MHYYFLTTINERQTHCLNIMTRLKLYHVIKRKSFDNVKLHLFVKSFSLKIYSYRTLFIVYSYRIFRRTVTVWIFLDTVQLKFFFFKLLAKNLILYHQQWILKEICFSSYIRFKIVKFLLRIIFRIVGKNFCELLLFEINL